MNRTRSITIAAILVVVHGILNLMSAPRILSGVRTGLPSPPGSPSGPPFWAGLLFMTLGVACLFAAYGLWKNQKWGKVVAIVTSAIDAPFLLGNVIGDIMAQNYMLAFVFTLLTLACVLIIVLVLRREPGEPGLQVA